MAEASHTPLEMALCRGSPPSSGTGVSGKVESSNSLPCNSDGWQPHFGPLFFKVSGLGVDRGLAARKFRDCPGALGFSTIAPSRNSPRVGGTRGRIAPSE